MKIVVCMTNYVEVEVAENSVFHRLYDIHGADPDDVAPDEIYDTAMNEIEKIMGVPCVCNIAPEDEDNNVNSIIGVYAEDDTPILEF